MGLKKNLIQLLLCKNNLLCNFDSKVNSSFFFCNDVQLCFIDKHDKKID